MEFTENDLRTICNALEDSARKNADAGYLFLALSAAKTLQKTRAAKMKFCEGLDALNRERKGWRYARLLEQKLRRDIDAQEASPRGYQPGAAAVKEFSVTVKPAVPAF